MPDVAEDEDEEGVDSSESEIEEIYPDSAARRQWKTFTPHHRAGTIPMDVDEDGARTKAEPEELTLPPVEEVYDDFLDPSIRPPYLPFKTVEFSCRPNGPKLYDILGAKPLDRFGILGWSIIDREEELFEMDGVRDEDKVMQALWCRWITLNRQKHFIRNYLEGTKQFIRDNHRYIRRAAGWLALRAWLLVLHQTRFLKIEEVVDALELYESLADTQ
ncbi:hypothetical protein BDM02DRAFT_3114856 [Thelephora ganbajun]|uniref:Uncharacterized protein n=1 Tax=Thelephora ganbajun TaxID=370292 RepID=A0ACB6ZGY1_THEGA|nr:hypothetical protein BDM02DRAFT_3114856 [Thelephora ganbajun]